MSSIKDDNHDTKVSGISEARAALSDAEDKEDTEKANEVNEEVKKLFIKLDIIEPIADDVKILYDELVKERQNAGLPMCGETLADLDERVSKLMAECDKTRLKILELTDWHPTK